jgi:MFS family permease
MMDSAPISTAPRSASEPASDDRLLPFEDAACDGIVPKPEAPAPSLEVRSAYLDQSVIGYLLYGVGAITAFLAVLLSLSDAQAGLHSSVLAVGIAVAGLTGDRLDAIVGWRVAHLTAYLLLAAASVCLVTAPAFVVTLAGAGAVGLGTGLLLAHINRSLTRGGGTLARVRMARAALVAMVASLSVPLVIGLGENSGLGWQVAFGPAAILILIGLSAAWRRSERAPEIVVVAGRLPRRYWLAWWLVVLVVSVEFSIVFWASTLIERQVGISLGDATLVVAAFYAGMATARVGLSFPVVSGHDPLWLMRGSIAVALLGSLLAWATTTVELAGLGIFLGGLGVGFLYPLGVTVTLSLVPGLQGLASARLVLASGVAILVSPLALGLVADATDVSIAWLLVPAICLAALGLSVPVGRLRAA